MSPLRNSAGDAVVALGLLRHSPAWQWPGTASYFLGVLAKKLVGVRLFQHRVLRFKELRCYADVDGGCGLVFLYEIWVRKTYDALLGSSNGGSRVLFDVGANCGFLALRCCLRNPGLRAVCFEPHPRTFGVLQRNIELNGLAPRVTAMGCAVGAQSGTCRIELSAASSMAVVTPQSSGPARGASAVDVPLISLDDFCRERQLWPEILKIDVEGFEVEVLSGAAECLRQVKRLVLEFHSDDLRARCLQMLAPRFHTRIAGSLLFAEPQ